MVNGNPFLTWLRGLLREDASEDAAPPPEEEGPMFQPPSASPADPFLMELPAEHAVHKLFSLWREQAGWQPAPRFSFEVEEETQVLPEAAAARELARLKLSVNSSANKRLKLLLPPKGSGAAETPCRRGSTPTRLWGRGGRSTRR